MKSTLVTAYRLCAIVCTLLILIARPAHAYLDPGTGSYVTQIALASLVGAIFSAKLIFQGVARFFRNLLPSDRNAATLSTANPAVATAAAVSATREEMTHGASLAE